MVTLDVFGYLLVNLYDSQARDETGNSLGTIFNTIIKKLVIQVLTNRGLSCLQHKQEDFGLFKQVKFLKIRNF